MGGNNMKKRLISMSICILMIATAFIAAVGTVSASTNWPSLRYDNGNTGSTNQAPELQQLQWVSEDIDAKTNSPTVYQGYVYTFKSKSPKGVIRFNTVTGETSGTYISLTTIPSVGSITIANGGKLYFGSGSNMRCYNRDTGLQIWSTPVGGTIDGTATVADGKVFVGANTGKMICLDADDGTIIWVHDIPQKETDPPAVDVDNDRLYFCSQQYIYCLDTEGDGMGGTTEIWVKPFGSDTLTGACVLSGDYVYVVSSRIVKLSAETGNFVWFSFELEGAALGSLLVADERMYIGTTSGYLYCYADEGTSEYIWSKELELEGMVLPTSAVEVDGQLYVGTNQGVIFCLDANNQGETIWQYDTEDTLQATSPAIAGRRVFVNSYNYLFALGGPNNPPETPDAPEGPTRGRINVKHHFTVQNTVDPDDHDLYYNFDWDDDSESGWIGPFDSGDDVTVPAWHKYEIPGDYQVRVKAKDSLDDESVWSESLDVHIDFLEVHNVQGGLGVTCDIKNVADLAKDINWTVELVGGQITGFHIFRSFQGDITPLNAGDSEMVTASPVFGLGNFKVIVTAKCVGEEVEETFDAFALFFYIIIK